MPSTPADDPHIAAAIARCEARRALLERATGVIMTLLEETARERAAPADGKKAARDPVRAVTQLSRALRLGLAQETKLDEIILALRNGEVPRFASAGRAVQAKPSPEDPNARFKPDCPVRDPVQVAVWTAIEQSEDNFDDALHRFDRLHERLFESREYDRCDFGDFRGTVKAICADLGLEPDWTTWEKGGGFAEPTLSGRPSWRALWSSAPAQREARRKRLLAGPAGPVRPAPIQALARAGVFQLE